MAMQINPFFFLACLFSITILLPNLFISSLAGDDRSSGTATASYIVHMNLSAMPKAFSHPHKWYQATLTSASRKFKANSSSSSSSKLIYAYTHVINGFSATLSSHELEALKASPGYLSSTRDSLVKLHTTRSTAFLGLNHDFGAWPASHYGKDVIIGLVDTGVWPESESFNDDGMTQVPSRWKGECQSGTMFNASMCNKKLIGARYFNRGLIAKYPTFNIMNSSRDTDGHGTHTSTTAAGNYIDGASYFGYAPGTSRGVAPRARVAIYKAIWDEGGTDSDVLAAMDQAIMDGVDVLSMSIGTNEWRPLFNHTLCIAAFAAMEKGIFVAASAGNEGDGPQTLGNEAPWFLTVAASTIDRTVRGVVNLENGVLISGLSLYSGGSASGQLVYTGSCAKEVNHPELYQSTNKIIVCFNEDGLDLLPRYLMDGNFATDGYVIIRDHPDVIFELNTIFPTVFVDSANGQIVLDYINSTDKPKATLRFQETSIGTVAPMVAHYSSRGPSRGCPSVLKPDLTAPGTWILASVSEYKLKTFKALRQENIYGAFDIYSGTSMAAPHAAGVAALLKAVHPEWSPGAIRSAMMTTSDVVDNTFQPISERMVEEYIKTASPLAMGAGHINPNKAMDPGLIYDINPEDYVNLLCALNFTREQILMITRSSTYTCSKPTLDINYPSFIAFFRAKDANTTAVREFQRTVTYVGNGTATFVAKLTPLNGFTTSVIPDRLTFTEKYEKQSYKLYIEDPTDIIYEAVHGFLSWEETEGKHVVRSPIVVPPTYRSLII